MLIKIGNGQIMSYNSWNLDTTTIDYTVSSPDNLCSAIYSNFTMEYRLVLLLSCSSIYKHSFHQS